jgi:hypothetical protein
VTFIEVLRPVFTRRRDIIVGRKGLEGRGLLTFNDMRYRTEKFNKNKKSMFVYIKSIFNDRLLFIRGDILLVNYLIASCEPATGVALYGRSAGFRGFRFVDPVDENAICNKNQVCIIMGRHFMAITC